MHKPIVDTFPWYAQYRTLAGKDVICGEQWPQSSRICFMFRNGPNPNFGKLHGKVYCICQVPASFFHKPVACQHELIHTIAYKIIYISKRCLVCWFQGAMVAKWPLWRGITPTLSFSRFEFRLLTRTLGLLWLLIELTAQTSKDQTCVVGLQLHSVLSAFQTHKEQWIIRKQWKQY